MIMPSKPIHPQLRLTLGILAWTILLAATFRARGAAPPPDDSRNFANGRLIPDEDYCDQPRIIVTRNGAWVCILTTGPGDEGSDGQHVVATTSRDQGRTWSPLVDVEPARDGKKSSYALALVTPADRIYAFYCYNGDSIRHLPDGRSIRDDMQGWFCYRYSDDVGRTWSDRQRLPMRITSADRNNDWQGKLQMFWAIGTPAIVDGSAMFGFTKLGRYMLEDGEGWFFRCDNLMTERDPGRLVWRMLPEGDRGLRNADLGSVQEEHDIVHLDQDEFFCSYRTAVGYAACAYTRDGGRTWTKPHLLTYTPGGRPVKQPRACAKIWKTANGRYLLWYHNNSTRTYNNDLNAGSRNIAWLSAGLLVDGQIHWSQPEVVAYVDGGLEGCSYPDLVEDDGRYFICATQKTEARVMEVDPALLTDLWRQHEARRTATSGLALDLPAAQCQPGSIVAAPRFAPLCGQIRGRTPTRLGRGGFTIDLRIRFDDLSAGQVVLDARDDAHRGYVLRTTAKDTLRLEMSDGWTSAFWDCDSRLLRPGASHHITIVVDGGPKIIAFVIDKQLCDGGEDRLFGFGRFDQNLKDVSGFAKVRIAPALHGRLEHLRFYTRPLRVSEAVGNQRAGQ